MAQARIGWKARGGSAPPGGVSQKTKQQVLRLIAAALLAIGVVLLVVAFATLLSDRQADSNRGIAPSKAVAKEIEEAGLGCADFRIQVRRGTGVTGEGACSSEVGPLRIVVYRTPSARTFAENLSRAYQCEGLSRQGKTMIASVVGDTLNGVPQAWAIQPQSSDPVAAQRIGDAIGGTVTNFDCASLFTPAPPPPAEAPPPEAPPA